MTVQEVIERRCLTSLYHFTTIENYMSILERGFIYSRYKVEELSLLNDGFYTADFVDSMDQQRLDGLRDYINLSLSRPNWYLLEKYKKRAELSHFDWCILEIDLAPMLNEKTLYSVCNAASSTARKYGVKTGAAGLEDLFRSEVCTPRNTYTRRGIPVHFTTDIQAEVLVFEQISIEHIRHAYLPSKPQLARYQSGFRLMGLSNNRFELNSRLFEEAILR
ncbi:DarT ssDNA thymidine ADP-ribosyltransferase family protein [Vibrio campbellii]